MRNPQPITTPLIWIGGKAQFTRQISALFPVNARTAVSPFIGGGGIEIRLAKQGIQVHGYDANPDLVRFWQALLSNPQSLMRQVNLIWGPDAHAAFTRIHPSGKRVWFHLPFTKAAFYWMRLNIQDPALFYVVNRASFNGLMQTIGTHLITDEVNRARNLAQFALPTLSVNRADFRDSLAAHPYDFAYADPPYFGHEDLYAHTRDDGFPHTALRHSLAQHKGGFALSYNDHPYIRALYSGCHFTPLNLIYRASAGREGKAAKIGQEVVITDYEPD